MIIGNISDILHYKGIHQRLDIAFDHLLDKEYSGLECGKYQIMRDDIFFLVNDYHTSKDCALFLEAHRKYMDIQLVVDGEEIIEWENFNNQDVVESYNAEHDYTFYKSTFPTKLKLTKGMFCVFFSSDLHMPGIVSLKSSAVKKVVYKVLI